MINYGIIISKPNGKRINHRNRVVEISLIYRKYRIKGRTMRFTIDECICKFEIPVGWPNKQSGGIHHSPIFPIYLLENFTIPLVFRHLWEIGQYQCHSIYCLRLVCLVRRTDEPGLFHMPPKSMGFICVILRVFHVSVKGIGNCVLRRGGQHAGQQGYKGQCLFHGYVLSFSICKDTNCFSIVQGGFYCISSFFVVRPAAVVTTTMYSPLG